MSRLPPAADGAPQLIVISAKNEERLAVQANQMLKEHAAHISDSDRDELQTAALVVDDAEACGDRARVDAEDAHGLIVNGAAASSTELLPEPHFVDRPSRRAVFRLAGRGERAGRPAGDIQGP